MKTKFDTMFVLFSVFMFYVTDKNIASCVLLLSAGVNMLISAINDLKDWRAQDGGK